MADLISHRFDAVVQKYPQRTALFDGNGRPVTFERLYYSVHSLAEALLEREVRKGNLVGNLISERATHVALTLALLRIGARVALFLWSPPRPNEMSPADYCVVAGPAKAADPRLLVLDRSWLKPANGPVAQRGIGAVVMSTSGTTGLSKIQPYSDEAFMGRLNAGIRAFGAPDDTMLLGYNSSTMAGFQLDMLALLSGVTSVTPDPDPARTLRTMADTGVAIVRSPPILIRNLLEAARRASGPVPQLKTIVVGGAGISPQMAIEAEGVFGCALYTNYGSTEVGYVARFRPAEAPDRPGTVGRIRRELGYKFLDDTGNEAGEGELHLKVPEVERGGPYLNAAGPYDEDGWVATGDIGTIGTDGNLVITGRRSEFINSGGTKRAPEIYERRLAQVAGIREATAFGLPNDWGSEDVAILAVADRTAALDEAIRKTLSAEARQGFVFRVFFVDGVPRTAAAKIDRGSLAALYRDRAAHLMIE